MGEEGEKSKEIEFEVGKSKEVVVMDTPERSKNQIVTPVSKFEESPVFNFLNNLSPIKPVKSVHISQSLNALSFASLPSVFTSPHVCSLKESRFLRRSQLVDPSKPEFSSDNGNRTHVEEGYTNVSENSSEQQESIDPGNSIGEVSEEQSYDCSKLAVDLARTLNYDTPISSSKTRYFAEGKPASEFASTSGALVPFGQAVSGKGVFGNGVSMEEMILTSQTGDATGYDWENLITDAADLLIFDSPDDVGTAKRLLDPANGVYGDKDMQDIQALGPAEQGDGNETDNPSTQPGYGSYMKEFSEIQEVLADSSLKNSCKDEGLCEQTDNEPVSNLYRGMRRRCLVFEMGGTRRKHFDGKSSSVSPIITQDGNTPSSSKQVLPMETGNDASKRILPGIGLHLNALAAAPKGYKVVKQDSSVSGRLVIVPSSTSNFHSSATVPETVNQSLAIIPMEMDMDPVENGVPLLEYANQASMHMVTEEFNQSSPKKKRRKVEQPGESESCKRCNCKKSKCLKLYCECFAAGVYCVEPCSCIECFNKPIHEDTVLATRKQIESRNPLAFAPKVIRNSDSLSEAGDDSTKTPASARHKRGCNCKKSGCLKKYCECYQGGVGCSINCRCEGCKNAFGKKDGSLFITTEAELEEDETEVLEKSMERTLHKTGSRNEVEQNPESAPPMTPFRCPRPFSQVPFSSKRKPPRSKLPSMAAGPSSLFTSQGLDKTPFLPPPQPKFDNHINTVMEDEMPEILQGNGSPISSIKSSSPNSKRVSPPHCNFGMSPGRRSSRKLILQSIPAFPSLTPKH